MRSLIRHFDDRFPRAVLGVAILLLLSVSPVALFICAEAKDGAPSVVTGKGWKSGATGSLIDPVLQARSRMASERLSLRFEANVGQADSEVKFLARASGYTLFLTPTGAILSLLREANPPWRNDVTPRHISAQTEPERITFRMCLVGANRSTRVTGIEELPGKSNYIRGRDPKQWQTNVPTYRGVLYRGLYPKVDLVFYGHPRGPEYDFVVAPGGDPSVIRLSFEGVQRLHVDRNGELVLGTAGAEIRHRRPTVYQEIEGVRRLIKRCIRTRGSQKRRFQSREL